MVNNFQDIINLRYFEEEERVSILWLKIKMSNEHKDDSSLLIFMILTSQDMFMNLKESTRSHVNEC